MVLTLASAHMYMEICYNQIVENRKAKHKTTNEQKKKRNIKTSTAKWKSKIKILLRKT